MAKKVIYQMHHIRYGSEEVPEWKIELRMWMHRAITRLAQLKPTPENYAELINFQTAFNQLVNDMRMRLDTEGDD